MTHSKLCLVTFMAAAPLAACLGATETPPAPTSGITEQYHGVQPKESEDAGECGIQLDGTVTYAGYNPATNKCDHCYPIKLVPPQAGENAVAPLFLYFTGTKSSADAASAYDQDAALAVLYSMANPTAIPDSDEWLPPHYSMSVDYYNDGTDAWVKNLACIYGSARGEPDITNPDKNVLKVACSVPGVDCSTITAWGFSQGATMAIWAHDYNKAVKAAWVTGYSNLPCWPRSSCAAENWPQIPADRLRIVNAANDGNNSSGSRLDRVTNVPAPCGDKATNCLKTPNGGGWYLVQQDEIVNPVGHCWFEHPWCKPELGPMEPAWWKGANSTGTARFFSLPASVAWLKARASKD